MHAHCNDVSLAEKVPLGRCELPTSKDCIRRTGTHSAPFCRSRDVRAVQGAVWGAVYSAAEVPRRRGGGCGSYGRRAHVCGETISSWGCVFPSELLGAILRPQLCDALASFVRSRGVWAMLGKVLRRIFCRAPDKVMMFRVLGRSAGDSLSAGYTVGARSRHSLAPFSSAILAILRQALRPGIGAEEAHLIHTLFTTYSHCPPTP